jgi:adenosine deaminase
VGDTGDLAAFVRALPKAELHLHLEGSVAASTLAELARKHRIDLGFSAIEELYRFDDLASFLRMYGIVCDAVRSAGDFERMTYEALARVAGAGGRYAEVFFSPHAHAHTTYATMLDGIISGMHAAAIDYDVFSQLIPAHNRELGPEAGLAFVDMVVSDRREEIAGIGLDYMENDPRPFARMYDYARSEGLHVTAHAGEIGPAAFVRDSLEVLGCERIDHGYHVIDDDGLVASCRTAGTVFTCCPTTTLYTTEWRNAAAPEHAIRRMLEAGLTLTINTDDPGLMQTTLVEEYMMVAEHMGATAGQLKAMCLNGIRGSWLDAGTKREMLAAWSAEIDGLTV